MLIALRKCSVHVKGERKESIFFCSHIVLSNQKQHPGVAIAIDNKHLAERTISSALNSYCRMSQQENLTISYAHLSYLSIALI